MMKLFFLFFLFVPFLCFNQLNQIDAKGKKQGVWQKTYPESKNLIYKGQFIDDQEVGIFTYYYKSGKLKSVIEHIPNSNQRSFVTFYFEDGAVLSEGMYKNQLKDSVWYNYTSFGALSSKENYKLNKLNGEKIIYYIEGQLENNILSPLSVSNYSHDYIDGLYSEFFTLGEPKIRGYFKNGIKDGEWLFFHLDGYINKKIIFRNKLNQTWIYNFDKDGVKLSEMFFENQVLLKDKELELFLKKCADNGINPSE